ncbi:MAG: hypothetical protein WCH75_12505 [Candidatus Binatia bacterium]
MRLCRFPLRQIAVVIVLALSALTTAHSQSESGAPSVTVYANPT